MKLRKTKSVRERNKTRRGLQMASKSRKRKIVALKKTSEIGRQSSSVKTMSERNKSARLERDAKRSKGKNSCTTCEEKRLQEGEKQRAINERQAMRSRSVGIRRQAPRKPAKLS